jgi:hypothetical protein
MRRRAEERESRAHTGTRGIVNKLSSLLPKTKLARGLPLSYIETSIIMRVRFLQALRHSLCFPKPTYSSAQDCETSSTRYYLLETFNATIALQDFQSLNPR